MTDDESQKVGKLPNGQYNAFDAIYSNLTLTPFNGNRDRANVTVRNTPLDSEKQQYLDEIKIMVPEGFRDVISLDTTRPARICVGKRRKCKYEYRAKVRAMLTNKKCMRHLQKHKALI